MNGYIYCGFWRRSIAVVLDRIFLIIFLLICIIMILLSNLPLADTLSDSFISTLIILSLTILYDPIFESSSMQATLG